MLRPQSHSTVAPNDRNPTKRAYRHGNTVELLHDILCLANSYADGDRHLLFGVSNNRTILGVEANNPRRNQANIYDLMRASRLNRIPKVLMEKVAIDGHEVDVLTIVNRPDKPFFLVADKAEQGKCLRAGVVYTRLGDTNVPMNQCPPEDRIELMWRERFGIGLPPLVRLNRYLLDEAAWERLGGDEYVYLRTFPEFTIVTAERDRDDSFTEPWVKGFPDPDAYKCEIEARYHATILLRMTFVVCDGGRYTLPLPSVRSLGKNKVGYYLLRDSHKFRVAKLLRQNYPVEETMTSRGVEIYDSERDVPASDDD
jgi:hypothetical protein